MSFDSIQESFTFLSKLTLLNSFLFLHSFGFSINIIKYSFSLYKSLLPLYQSTTPFKVIIHSYCNTSFKSNTNNFFLKQFNHILIHIVLNIRVQKNILLSFLQKNSITKTTTLTTQSASMHKISYVCEGKKLSICSNILQYT